ncbi:putative cytochrome-like protein P450 [Periconia macrospinosa]|uniref:Putative cytochrome-like protein P450 n=1 Tax=Periconia macrospinosa TaxID=97972 RepID=A0A2V1E640_9PLEO|nr:putative cytochrome-like protein P450 [Periconia macrospinosa]
MIWLILFIVIAIPFLTHYITSILFNRNSANKNSPRNPPTIPYWIPGLCHALGLLSKPSTYFALLIKKHGFHAPFFVRMGRVSYLIVRNPEQCRDLLRGGLKTTWDLVEVYSKVFGMNGDALKYYETREIGDGKDGESDAADDSALRKYMEDAELKALADVFVSVFSRNMSNKMFQTSTWTQIEDFWSFLEIETTRATIETLFGSALLKQYPKLVRDLWDFNSKVDEFLPGLPAFTISSSVQPRDRLLEGIKKWLQATHGGTDFAKIEATDPAWDETKGSKFIQERDAMFARLPSFNYQARASECLRVMHNITSATTPSTFWHTLETLRNPALSNFLSREIIHHMHSNNNQYDILSLSQHPNLRSLALEVKRLRTGTYLFHTITTTTTLSPTNDKDKGGVLYTVPKDTTLLTFSHDLALNTNLWSHARPSTTTTRPLTEFAPDRFLIPDKSASTKRYRKGRDSVVTGSFSLDGIETLCGVLGRDGKAGDVESRIADVLTAAAVVVLGAGFEMEACDEEDFEGVLEGVGVEVREEGVFGVVRPRGRVAVRLRVRG